MTFLEWLESTWLSTAIRDSPNVFLYPSILAFHTIGLAFLVGMSAAVSLRVLGVAPQVPLAPLKKFFPIMVLGFWVNAISGLFLVLVEPTRFLTMTDFYIKLVAITGAIVCMRMLYNRNFRRPEDLKSNVLTRASRILAAATLTLWGAAITAGRITAYDGAKVQRDTAIATFVVAMVMVAAIQLVTRIWGWARSRSAVAS